MNQRHTSFALLPTLLAMFLAACDGPKAGASTSLPRATPAEPIASSASSAMAGPTSPPALPATYDIDASHSRLTFSVRHMMVSNTRGQFGKFSGTAFIDEASPGASKVNLDIETASLDSSDPKRDEHLRSADFFDVKRCPRMTFRSTHVERVGAGWQIAGDLTIRAATKPVVLHVDAISPAVKDPWGGTRRGTRARAELDRRAFGLTWNKTLEAGGVVVGDVVTLELEVELVEKKA